MRDDDRMAHQIDSLFEPTVGMRYETQLNTKVIVLTMQSLKHDTASYPHSE